MSAERQHPATPKRRQQARREGRVARSGVLVSATVLLTSALAITLGLGAGMHRLATFTEHVVRSAFERPEVVGVLERGLELLADLCGPVLLLVFGAAALGGYAQVGGLFSARIVRPDPGRVRLRRPGAAVAATWDAARGAVVLLAGAVALRIAAPTLLVVSRETLPEAVAIAAEACLTIGPGLLAVVAVLGVFDWLVARTRYERSLRMTTKEREDEVRQTEGDPAVRSRLRVLADRAGGGASAEGAERDPAARVGAAAGEVEARD